MDSDLMTVFVWQQAQQLSSLRWTTEDPSLCLTSAVGSVEQVSKWIYSCSGITLGTTRFMGSRSSQIKSDLRA